MGDGHPDRDADEDRWRSRLTSADNMRRSRERYESWLYDAIVEFERNDPAHSADHPAHNPSERLLRTLCRVVERLLPAGTTADEVAKALAVETELTRR